MQHHVCPLNFPPASVNAKALDLILRLPQTSGVNDMQGYAAYLNCLSQRIPSRTREGRHDGTILTCQSVEQAGLAYIGLARQDNMQTVSKQTALTRPPQQPPDILSQAVQFSRHIGLAQGIDFFLGEVESSLNQHSQGNESFHYLMRLPRKLATERPHCGTGRGRSSRLDQIGHSFSLRQIQFFIEIGTPGKFTGLRQARTQFKATLQQQLHHHRSAMALQFKHVFPCI